MLEVKCLICGRKEEIDSENKDYKKISDHKTNVYICTLCQAKMFHEAKESQKPHKPM